MIIIIYGTMFVHLIMQNLGHLQNHWRTTVLENTAVKHI